MTFDQIVTEVKDRVGLTSAEATTRVGREVNTRYKRITSAPWLDVFRRTRASANTTNGGSDVAFTSLEKIERVVNENTSPWTVLSEVTYDEIGTVTLASGAPTRYAIKSATATSVTIQLDVLAASVYALKADGLATVATLSGANVPAFPESFHDILIEGVVADELRRMEKSPLAEASEQMFEQRLEDLRLFVTKATDMSRSPVPKKRVVT